MCISSKSSLVLFTSGCVGSLLLLFKTGNMKYFSMLFIILIQLGEYLMWIDIENKGKYPHFNIIGNYIAIISLFLQTSGLNMIMPKKYGIFIIIPNIVYYLVLTYLYTKKVYNGKKDRLTQIGKSKTLSWAILRNISTLKWIGLILYIIANIYNNYVHFNSYINSLLNLVLIAISMKFVYSFHTEYFGSMYCYSGAVFLILHAVYQILVNT